MASAERRVAPRSTALGYALLAPSLFGVLAFLLLPILVVIWLSLCRWDLLGPLRFVGLSNWRSVLTDAGFGNSLMVTAVFVAMVVPAQTALGLLAATMLARRCPAPGCSAPSMCCRGFARRWPLRCCGAGSWRPPTAR